MPPVIDQQLYTTLELVVHPAWMHTAGNGSAHPSKQPLMSCITLPLVAKRLCTTFVDPHALAPFLACRLIALDKHSGVRPISICEVPCRIIAKAVLSEVRGDVLEAVGVHQLCAGQIAGVESAINAVGQCFEDSGSEGVLLVDALNTFNSLNRKSALVHVLFLCPSLSTVLINCYRQSVDVFVNDTSLLSEEGTTQGDP